MAIVGLTHTSDMVPNKKIGYRGKISTGYAPGEGPNKENHPVAAGFFRFLVEKTVNERVGTKVIPIKKFMLNKGVQKKLEEWHNQGDAPRMLEIISLFYTPEDMWESYMAMYGKSDGLLCKSHGKGTEAKYLDVKGKNREWKTRTCQYDECEHYKAGNCKPHGSLKCYPTVDFTPPNPYRFETNSINTIISIESALDDIYNMLKVAHVIKQQKLGKDLKFDGLFGVKFVLVHKKIKSGGREVFVTEIMLSKDSREATSGVIEKAFLEDSGISNSISLIDSMESLKIETDDTKAIESVEIDEDDIVDVEAEPIEDVEVDPSIASKAAEALLDE